MKKYTKEFKQKVVDEHKSGMPCKDICMKYSIPKSCLYDWLKLYDVKTDKKSSQTFTYEQYLSLQMELEKTKMELDIIKLSHCFTDSPRKQKQAAIENLMDKFRVKDMCRVLNLPTGTFYNYHLRRVRIKQNDLRDEWLKEQILLVFNESGQRFGSTKIQAKLATMGIKTSATKVFALMKEMGIKSKQCRKRTFSPQKNALKFCWNHLKREFNQTEPNKYWVGDVTELRVGSAKFYLCVILDLFSRKVIAYRLASQNNSSLVINTFKDAYENRNRPSGLSFHSDQGTPYLSDEYRTLLHSLKVKQSFSNKGNPYDNAVIEAFFSVFKREEINSHNFEFFDELKDCVDAYMQYYNDYRPHETLKNKTPNQVENDYMLEAVPALSG